MDTSEIALDKLAATSSKRVFNGSMVEDSGRNSSSFPISLALIARIW